MEVAIRADRQGDHGYLVPSGAFDLLHATAVARSLDTVRSQFETCRSVELDLAHLDHIDGTGAALLARLLDRLDAGGLPNACCGRSQPGSSAPDRTVSRTRSESPGATAQDEPLGADWRRGCRAARAK